MQNPRIINNRTKKVNQLLQPNLKPVKPKEGTHIERNFGKDLRNMQSLNGNNKSVQNKDMRSILTLKDAKPKIIQETEKKKGDTSYANISKLLIDKQINSFIVDEEDIPEMDLIFKGNLSYLSEYSNSIFKDLFANESKFTASSNYLLKHTEINEACRLKIIDWIIDVHQYMELVTETLYLTVNLLDRYLSLEVIPATKLQLVGVTALFIASKYEEIYPPEMKDFIFICKGKFSKQDILNCEGLILNKLEFNILTISPLLLFNRLFFISAKSKDNLRSSTMNLVYYLGHFLMELSLMEYTMLEFPSSIISSAALFFSRKVIGEKPAWPNKEIDKQVIIDQELIISCAKKMFQLVKKERASNLKTLRQKYSKPCFQDVYNKFKRSSSNKKKQE